MSAKGPNKRTSSLICHCAELKVFFHEASNSFLSRMILVGPPYSMRSVLLWKVWTKVGSRLSIM